MYRTARAFISSSFRDFGEERNLLVKQTFQRLRRLCAQRDVSLVEVDLRWGITAAQAESGRVVPICLTEIDHCRPYFLCMLGQNNKEGGMKEEHEGGKRSFDSDFLYFVYLVPNHLLSGLLCLWCNCGATSLQENDMAGSWRNSRRICELRIHGWRNTSSGQSRSLKFAMQY